ncbi:MAG: hypothetical protein HC780_02725 [Leptolyngbyaceae cyanobacterium CSU_1_3]|nr:hypothetical protein [Leptolyngbyaceae cyanobacterium CSU_1_3]
MLKHLFLTAALSAATLSLGSQAAMGQFAGSVNGQNFNVSNQPQVFTSRPFGSTRRVIVNPYHHPSQTGYFGNGTVIIERDRFSDPFSRHRIQPVIVTPIIRPRTVIINPDGYSGRYYGGGYRSRYRDGYSRRGYYGTQSCGTMILGSPISSPIPVNPITGTACR